MIFFALLVASVALAADDAESPGRAAWRAREGLTSAIHNALARLERHGRPTTQQQINAALALMPIEHVDEFERDCAYKPTIVAWTLSERGHMRDMPGDECAVRDWEQSCLLGEDLGDCTAKGSRCVKPCLANCAPCARTCASTCDACKDRCDKDRACVRKCAESRALCRNDCWAREHVCRYSCGRESDACYTKALAARAALCDGALCQDYRSCLSAASSAVDRAAALAACEVLPLPDEKCRSWCDDAG